VPAIGIASFGVIKGDSLKNNKGNRVVDGDSTSLDINHTVFILVDDGTTVSFKQCSFGLSLCSHSFLSQTYLLTLSSICPQKFLAEKELKDDFESSLKRRRFLASRSVTAYVPRDRLNSEELWQILAPWKEAEAHSAATSTTQLTVASR
jgi:hypothetical protein